MIKLRDTLEEIINNPSTYSRIKVPKNIYDTIIGLHQLRSANNLLEVRNANSFPKSRDLEDLERKYGDSLTNFDQYGIKTKKKAKKQRGRSQLGSLDRSSIYSYTGSKTTRPG